jgi:hypothetical protein
MTVGLQASLGELGARCSDFGDAMTRLRLTLVEDRPSDIALADGMAAVVDDIQGWVEECEHALREAPSSSRTSADLEAIVECLAGCRYAVSKMLGQFSQELGARQRIDHLTAVGRERGGAWMRWAGEVKRSIDVSDAALREVVDSLLGCYQEVADRIGAGSVTATASSVGVSFGAPPTGVVGRVSSEQAGGE